jgi:S1-C subfamily serine protease
VLGVVERYTVYISTDTSTGSSVSLGDGKVLTNYHVVPGAKRITIRFNDGSVAAASVERYDARRDLARVASKAVGEPTAPLGDAANLFRRLDLPGGCHAEVESMDHRPACLTG